MPNVVKTGCLFSSMIKRSLLLLFFIVLANQIVADGVSRGEIRGMISDRETMEELPFASVQLRSIDDSTAIFGAITDINGSYSIKHVPFGQYYLLASFMGYETEEQVVDITKRKAQINISLSKKNFTLKEIEVTAEKGIVEQGINKTTVNVSKDATLTGGSAVDVMQTLPSVDFDVNGQLNYRGSENVTLLLNGQRSELVKSLDQIPADQIEKIEIINNPSAKFEAEGMSGIINIVLKSGKTGRNNTRVMLYAGLPEAYGGSLGWSGDKGKSSFVINGGYNHKTRFQTKEHWRENYESRDAPDYYQFDRQDEILNDVLLNTSYNLRIDDHQQFGISFLGSSKFNAADRSIDYITEENGQTLYESHKDIAISLDNMVLDGNLDYQYNFNKTGQTLIANFHYSWLDQLQQMDNVYYPSDSYENRELQNTDSKQLNKEAVFSLDYAQPFTDSILLETGYRFNGKDLLNDFSSESYNPVDEIWGNDTDLGNNFRYLQNINALYADLQIKFSFFELQAGLRAEYTSNEQLDQQKEDYFDLFPSLMLSKDLAQGFNIFISYNRRINRPTIKMLNPYTNEYADILNMHVGNPDLKPEYVNSFELGTYYIHEKISGSASAYYRNIDQAISRVKSATNDSALLVTFMNLENAKLVGGEIAFSWKVFNWWNINANANIFYTTLKGEYGPNQIERSHTGWTGNLSNKFWLPLGIGFQMNCYYRSILPDVMGIYMERYYIDLAVDKKVIKGKGKVVFKISDVFNTYRYGLDLVGVDENGYEYSQKNRRKNESQYFILSFVYNIEGKEKQDKKENYYLESFGK
jgi:outer membrane receptor protein involved in Fe transport